LNMMQLIKSLPIQVSNKLKIILRVDLADLRF
jgi:hypothetical protein